MTWETYFCLAHFMFNHLNNTVTTRREGRKKKTDLNYFQCLLHWPEKQVTSPSWAETYFLSCIFFFTCSHQLLSFIIYLETRAFHIRNDREGRVYPWHVQSFKKSIWERDKGSKMTGFNAFKCTPHKDKLQISFCFSSLVIKLDQISPPKYAL